MLQPITFPSNYPTPCKSAVFEQQAEAIGFHDEFYRPPLTTTFRAGINQAGVHMLESTGSGNECTGVNDGSKNSVLVTYLSDAWARGAELFCEIDVRYIKKKDRGKGYIIFYEISNGKSHKVTKWVSARELVFLGAGALGTTEVLLRSQRYGLCTSPLLGHRLTGNGDMLAFAYNCDREIGSIGHESSESMDARSCGPTITSCIDMRGPKNAKNVRDGYVIQDGAVPEALGPVIQGLIETQTTTLPSRSFNHGRKLLDRLRSWILGPYAKDGSVRRTLVFLTMSHDEKEGAMTLANDTAYLQWSGIGNKTRSANIDSVLLEMTENLGGKLVKAPCITVHPLGGAVMSNDETGLGGVVDHRGQVFAGKGDTVHEGIFCVDGSVIPTSLGVNPCATITALAERSCDLIMKERGWTADESSNGILNLPKKQPIQKPGETQPPGGIKDLMEGVQFVEVMSGHVHLGSKIPDFEAAERMSKVASSSARVTLTVDARRVSEDSYQGMPQGTFACGAISQDPLLVTGGTVEFFTPDKRVADAVNLVYKLDLLSTDGARYGFHGYKRLDSTAAFSVSKTWGATTTLLTTITGPDGSLVGRGILHLSLYDFFSELWSLRSHLAISAVSDFQAQARFLGFFARNIASYMFSPFRQLRYPSPPDDISGYYEKPKPVVSTLTAEDGVEFPIKLWHPPSSTPQKSTPIVLIPGSSVDEQIFSLPTISTNTIDYFTSLGHRCYVPVLRFGKGREARRGDTAYDARLDVRAAIQHIREREQGRKIYVIAHCLGSIATGIALLTGDVEASWIKGMTCSQVFINLIFSPDNDFKARHPLLIKTYKVGLSILSLSRSRSKAYKDKRRY
ncbi:FAD/NAD(P)-binding domain-containing protein [Stemphylium lycopersici]|nr:cholesterol oxidase [Stemphylium lycopersici]RAR07475.1 FAD/NAD(P)-binding domain-containing protein [Stemphylium lycopersici]